MNESTFSLVCDSSYPELLFWNLDHTECQIFDHLNVYKENHLIKPFVVLITSRFHQNSNTIQGEPVSSSNI